MHLVVEIKVARISKFTQECKT